MERDIFETSGPTHLNPVVWNINHHRRSIAACLVQSTYLLERDRQLNSSPDKRLAPPWWEFFRFELVQTLVDDVDASIFGAIFELTTPVEDAPDSPNAPRFAIAFRGTMTENATITRDLSLDLSLVQHNLHSTSRFTIAMQAVKDLASASPGSAIWLAGHSLGAAMAILVGKNMAKLGSFLETFLFNPPFVAAPLERVADKKVKQGFRIARSFITAGLTIALKAQNNGRSASAAPVASAEDDHFGILSSWIPNLFVNPSDDICSEYIGYFEHRTHMEELGAGFIEKLATRNSIGNLLFKSMGMESDPLHLLPSANLVVNRSPSPDFSYAHGLHQWWQPDLNLQCTLHLYDS